MSDAKPDSGKANHPTNPTQRTSGPTHTSHKSHDSHRSQSPTDSANRPILSRRGDYKTLLSYQKSVVIYDITFRFAKKYLRLGDRTIDQMIQSARSGKQNIAEGSKAAMTSTETEIKLTNVAKASLAELVEDYEDYLRVRDLRQWPKDSEQAIYVRELGKQTPQTYERYRQFVETRSDEVVANIALCLLHQTIYLLDRQLERLERDFIEQGGLRERMTRARLNYRQGNRSPK